MCCLIRGIVIYGYARTSSYSRSSSYTKTVTLESKLGNDKNEVSAVSSTGSGTGQSQIVESGRNRSGEFKHLTEAEMREKEKRDYVLDVMGHLLENTDAKIGNSK